MQADVPREGRVNARTGKGGAGARTPDLHLHFHSTRRLNEPNMTFNP